VQRQRFVKVTLGKEIRRKGGTSYDVGWRGRGGNRREGGRSFSVERVQASRRLRPITEKRDAIGISSLMFWEKLREWWKKEDM